MKKTFFLILVIFSFFFFKNVKSANTELVLECPGLKLFNKWCAGLHNKNKDKLCIMVSIPSSKKGEPPYKSRGEVYVTIYQQSSENSDGTIYVTTGYNYKNDSIVKIKIDNNKEYDFNVLEADTAFSDDENTDKRLILEMKKGNNMKVVGYSTRGTKTTDIYSLAGFSAAYSHMTTLCKVKK